MYTEDPSEKVFIRERKAPGSMSSSQQNTGTRLHSGGIPLWKLQSAIFGPVLLFIVIVCVQELIPVESFFPGAKSSPPDIPRMVFITILSLLAGGIIDLLIVKLTLNSVRTSHDIEQEKILSNILIQDSPTLFLAIHSDGSIIMASNSLLHKLGYNREEVMGENCLNLFIPPQEHEDVFQSIRKLLESRTPQKNESSILSREGRRYILQWEARSAYREDGALSFIYIAGIDITEQKEAQISLQFSEERYRSFIQNLHGIAYQADIDNIPIFLHGDIEQITGYREQDFLTGSVIITDLILPVDHDGIMENLKKLRSIPEYTTELTYRIRTKDGQIRWIRDFIQNTSDNSGTPTGIMGIIYDITLNKEAEASLLKSNERYTLLAENVKDVIWAVDNDIRYTYISPSVEKMRGYTMEEVMTMPMEKMFAPESYIKMKKLLQQVNTMRARGEISDLKKSLTFEIELICKDSSTIWAEVTASYLIGKDGNPAGFVGITRDISERKLAEESIRRSEETYRTIFESTGTAMAIIDHDGVISLANTEFQDLSGYTRDEIEGKKSWKDFISPEDIERVPTYLGRGKMGIGTAQRNFDFLFLDRSGRKKYVFTTSTKIPVSEQTVVSLIDITDSKKDSEELKVSREHLRNLNKHSQDVRERERTRVAREIHDELGQVLTALKMDLSYLAKKLPAELPSLKTKTNLMLRFVDMTIQSVKRITMDLRPGLLDHLGLIAAIEWQAEEFEKRTGIRYALSFDPDDMNLDPDLSTSVFRIFQETLTNVARHAHATEIKISLLEKDRILKLTVTDNGIGISKDQIENPKSFGLMGIRERAYFSGGEARIFGQKGKGTIVSVSIPIPERMRAPDDTSACC